MDCLLGRAALPVDRCRRYRLGQPGRQHGDAADVRGLRPDLVDTAEDRVINRGRVNARSVDHGGQHVRGQVGRVHPGQGTVAPADRGTGRADQIRLTHAHASVDGGTPRARPLSPGYAIPRPARTIFIASPYSS